MCENIETSGRRRLLPPWYHYISVKYDTQSSVYLDRKIDEECTK